MVSYENISSPSSQILENAVPVTSSVEIIARLPQRLSFRFLALDRGGKGYSHHLGSSLINTFRTSHLLGSLIHSIPRI